MNWGRNWTLVLLALTLPAAVFTPAAGQTTAAPGASRPAAAAADTIRLVPATAAESLLTTSTVPAGERWSLARCVQTALEQNADIRTAHARSRQASGAALGSWSGIIPSVTTEASYTQIRPDKARSQLFDPSGTFLGVNTKQEFSTLSATASSNVISAPSIGEKRRRDHLHRGSEFDEIETRNQVVYQVKQQYFVLLKADRLAQVARETEKLARDEETRADALFQVGTVARGDVLKARARRATTQGDRLKAESQVEIQAAKLGQIIGVRPGQRIVPDPKVEEGIVIPDSAAAIRMAIAARPRLESAKAAESAARSNLFGARAVRLPSVTAAVTVDRSRIDETVEGPFGDFSPTRYATEWQGSVRASLPIFDGLAIEGRVRQAKGAMFEAESQRRQRELDVAVEVQQAWLTLREAVQRIDVAREGLTSAEEDYKFSKGRYELGAGTYLDLLTSEVGLATARQSLVEAAADARIAEAGLEFAVGAKRY
ncbi:MAG TPA: TolC family protein [Candidatus Dormibacteraeota bacterium]|nr:TolC family protein [Candidatus Dormibacteraeota bacterium]